MWSAGWAPSSGGVVGGAIGSTIGKGRGRSAAIGVGSALGALYGSELAGHHHHRIPPEARSLRSPETLSCSCTGSGDVCSTAGSGLRSPDTGVRRATDSRGGDIHHHPGERACLGRCTTVGKHHRMPASRRWVGTRVWVSGHAWTLENSSLRVLQVTTSHPDSGFVRGAPAKTAGMHEDRHESPSPRGKAVQGGRRRASIPEPRTRGHHRTLRSVRVRSAGRERSWEPGFGPRRARPTPSRPWTRIQCRAPCCSTRREH